MASDKKINDFKTMINDEISKLQKNGSFINVQSCKEDYIKFHLISMFIFYTQSLSCTNNSDFSFIKTKTSNSSSFVKTNNSKSFFVKSKNHDDFQTVSNCKSIRNVSSDILTQSAGFIYQAKIDFMAATLSKQSSILNSKTAFNLQQTAEKLMKGLIILNNSSLFYKTNLAHSHNLFVLAKNVSYDFKSLCFAIAKKIEALGTSSNYRQLVAIRSRYHKTVNDTIDCTTIPYLSFQNCDFIDIFETMEKLYFKTVNFLNLSTNSNNIHLGINNLVFQFEKFNIKLKTEE